VTVFREQIHSLVGKRVRLGRGGSDERKGTLRSVQDDYITAKVDDGTLVHYPLHHLKSVTEIVNGETVADPEGAEESLEALPTRIHDLFLSYLGQKVQVYDHGPESAAGFVFDVGEDFVKLVTTPDEIVHYPFVQIRSVRLTRIKGGGNNGKEKSGNSNKQGGQSDKQSVKSVKKGGNKKNHKKS
jgi:spore coat protein B